MRVAEAREGTIDEALALGPALLAHARAEREAVASATIVDGSFIVLGAHQRAGRVFHLEACARANIPVVRRATSGIGASITGKAIVWALALPSVDALFADATPRTLVNRNIRGFLRGFARAGAPAAYFGRACIVVQKQPAALIGFEVGDDGEVLMEIIAGIDAGVAIPEALATEAEREVDAARGSIALALGSVTRTDARTIAMHVLEGATNGEAASTIARPSLAAPLPRITRDEDPLPEGFERHAAWRVPIGWLDTASSSTGRVWLGGDALAGRRLLADLAESLAPPPPRELALEGARVGDLEDAVRRARDAAAHAAL